MKPNKIIQIITKLELGGAQEIVLEICNRLLNENYKVTLITNPEGILIHEARMIKGLKIYFIPELQREINPLIDIRCLLKIKKIIREENPDVIHTHSSKSGILGRIAAKMNNVPVIFHTIHGFGFNDYQNFVLKNILIALEKKAASYTDKLIAVSPAIMRKGLENKIGYAEKYQVIYNGIDIDLFQNTKVDRIKKLNGLGLKLNGHIVGMVACFKPQKGPQDFIRLANLVCKEIPDAQFVLIGDGVLRSEVENLIQKFNLRRNVYLLGWRRDVIELLSVMDIFALTSLWEGLPLTILEAMASGKPVVVNAIDGNMDIVKDGENGFLCEPRDVKKMAEKVIYLLKNPAKAKEMGEKGNQSVQKFDKEKMLEENIKLYFTAFSSRNP